MKSFKKCGISLTLDRKENDEINIEGITDYEMPHADEIDAAAVFRLESEDDSEDNADKEAELYEHCRSIESTVDKLHFNPLRPNNDVSQTSHRNIKGVSASEVMRIDNMITQVQF